MVGAAKMGMDNIRLIAPKSFWLMPRWSRECQIASVTGARITITWKHVEDGVHGVDFPLYRRLGLDGRAQEAQAERVGLMTPSGQPAGGKRTGILM